MSQKNTVRKKLSTAHHTGEGGISSLLLHSALGFLSSLLISLPLTLLGGVICAISSDPLSRIFPVSLVVLYLSSLFGGWMTRRIHRESALLSGLSSGILLTVFFLFLSLFFPDSGNLGFGVTFLLRALILFFSILGSYLGAPHPKRHKKRRR